MTYCIELYTNKLKEGGVKSLAEDDLVEFTKSLLENIKQNLKEEKDEKRNKLAFIGIIHFFDRFLQVLKSINSEKVLKNAKTLASSFEKIIEKFELKNMEKKVTEIKAKLDS
jgi:hypothetical protein